VFTLLGLIGSTLAFAVEPPKAPTKQGLANPASVNCTQGGGTLDIRTRPDGGQYGVCVFEDNRQCEEWALLRGDCPAGGLKITGYENEARSTAPSPVARLICRLVAVRAQTGPVAGGRPFTRDAAQRRAEDHVRRRWVEAATPVSAMSTQDVHFANGSLDGSDTTTNVSWTEVVGIERGLPDAHVH